MPIHLPAGGVLFLMGANGTGKSSLIHHVYSRYSARSRLITAHRQTWLESNSVNMSARQKQQEQRNIQRNDTNQTARWRDDYSTNRVNLAIADILAAEGARAQDIATAIDDHDPERALTISEDRPSPLSIISDLLKSSNLPISLSVLGGEELQATKRGEEYSIEQLSDGERNAFLLAANVLTAEPGTLFLIDEPERHLHKSIVAPLLESLISRRDDCAFVISTHDVTLPLERSDASVLLLSDCLFNEGSPSEWDAELLPSGESIGEDVKRDVLGARRRILFVEGSTRSLDIRLYGLAFPNIGIVPKGGHGEVERSVKAIRGSEDLHWADALGIIDRDGRPDSEVEDLSARGVYALDVYSMESIYYHPSVQQLLAERLHDDPQSNIEAARTGAIEEIAKAKEELVARALERMVRRVILERIPARAEIGAGLPLQIEVDAASLPSDPRDELDSAIETEDFEFIIRHHPLQATGALAVIAGSLGFRNRTAYEDAVLRMLRDDPEALEFVKSLFGGLAPSLEAPEASS